jgi:large subunit ribosomal protein L21
VTYAIIELGGKQYRVEMGDSLLVDRLEAKEGAKVSPRAVLFAENDKAVMEGPELDKVKVEAVVAEHLKGEKIRVFKYRPKKRYRRRVGHRSLLTRIEISQIKGPAATPKRSEPEAARKPAKKEGDAATRAKRPAARKPPSKKTTAKKDSTKEKD